jgi:hypothetical protein
MIKHENNKWVVKDRNDEKVLGTHDTKEDAQAQLAKIEIEKKKQQEKGKKK